MRIRTKPARTSRSRLHPRCGVCALLLFGVLAGSMALAQPAENGDELIGFLKQSGSADGKKRQTLDAQIAEQKSELDLAQARLETLEDMNAFTAAESAAGLLGKIAELERTVPELEAMERALHPPSMSEAGKTTASTPAP